MFYLSLLIGIKQVQKCHRNTSLSSRRFCPQMRNVCDQVQAGKIGQMHTIKTVARDAPRPPTSYLKISGGIFHDCAVHDLGKASNLVASC